MITFVKQSRYYGSYESEGEAQVRPPPVKTWASGLARAGQRVLLVDTDPQASLTVALGYPRPDELNVTLSDLMTGVIQDKQIRAGEGILHHPEGVDLVPANIALAGTEVALVNAMSREMVLKQYLETVKRVMTISCWTVCPLLGC